MQKALNFLATSKYLLPFDIYERHKFIGGNIPNGGEILDVGGSLSQLHYFNKPKKITTLDVKPPADIVYDGNKIPVEDNTFDIVTSIDVLEHVPRANRDLFMSEIYRIAKHKIVLSAPLGTNTHKEYEKKSLEYAKKNNIDMPYLEEHIANGLPTPDEIKNYATKYKGNIFYSGNLPLNEILFKIHTFEVKNKYANILIFLGKLVFNFFANILLYSFMTNRKLDESINRFYLIIEKDQTV